MEALARIEKNTLLAAKRVLNLDDASQLLGLSKSFVYKLTATHQLPCYRPGGKLLYFDRGEMEAWLLRNRQASQLELEQAAAAHCVTKSMMP